MSVSRALCVVETVDDLVCLTPRQKMILKKSMAIGGVRPTIDAVSVEPTLTFVMASGLGVDTWARVQASLELLGYPPKDREKSFAPRRRIRKHKFKAAPHIRDRDALEELNLPFRVEMLLRMHLESKGIDQTISSLAKEPFRALLAVHGIGKKTVNRLWREFNERGIRKRKPWMTA